MSTAPVDSGVRSRAVGVPVPGAMQASADRAEHGNAAAHPFAELLQQQKTLSSAVVAHPAAAMRDAPATEPSASAERSTQTSSQAPHDASQAKARGSDAPRAAARSPSAKTKASDGGTARANAREDDAEASTTGLATTAATTTAASAAASGSSAAVSAARQDATPAIAAQAALATDSTRLQAASTEATVGGDAATAPGTDPRLDSGAAAGKAPASKFDRSVSIAGAAGSPSDKDATALGIAPKATFADALAASTPQTPAIVAATDRPALDASGLAALQNNASTPATASTDGAPASAHVATPVDSPEFAAAFGMQVSALAKDGVQKAELHLNPAEMGPISIQITLDGKLAHVDFGADVAATRHAIEAGLPELASALRDAGFTLAGGGVAQHSASNGGGNGSGDDTSRGRSTMTQVGKATVVAIDAAAQRQSSRSAAGGVDVFA